ncbi:T9SS type A sorting domain-containing protein [Marinilongibacter aquaticus]|uniref:T9SS type A sorting domain-containing protein n=1 Tax=Marinilongibacter aquaticus TaxID=2975157 RepID=UPI0021BDB51C|nr:T9SS type A sorting domain-containing protein [Marinilongibacter aquaticus]UBM58479.1 T9SS type A sorting domain-containing protein [Marinilongibacter aquaticus]
MPNLNTKLTFFYWSRFLLILLFHAQVYAQECVEFESFDSGVKTSVDWAQFPAFDLPFDLVYGLPIQQGELQPPLQHGFTSVSDQNYFQGLSGDQAAQIYYGNAYLDGNQPWELLRSPWGNDLNAYKAKWQSDFAYFSGFYSADAPGIFCFDIERIWRFDHEILQLKSNASIPDEYKSLSDSDFLRQYKNDMRALYSLSVSEMRNLGVGNAGQIASYADTPIVNTFENIQGRTWDQWKTDKSVLNFLCTDENGNLGGSFYDQLDWITPSAYYYYDYPHPFAGEYLSYLLFQIEVNRAWTEKPVVPFVWMRYSFNPDVVNQYIRPWMAESTAIFPFFSGASGLWLWEDPFVFNEENEFSTYSYFLKGLYRLSRVKSFFEGQHELVMPISARDYNENQQPIWRAVFKDNEVLVAAHNPFAESETDEVSVSISYKNWSQSVRLKGYETKLCVYDLSAVLANEPNTIAGDLLIYPNPSNGPIKMEFESADSGKAEIRLLNTSGLLLYQGTLELVKGKNTVQFELPEGPERSLLLQIKVGNRKITKKIARH